MAAPLRPSARQTAAPTGCGLSSASFPTAQRLAQSAPLALLIRNAGSKTIPALSVTVSIAGKEGQNSSLPFAIRVPQPGLAQPDRPVWVLAAHFPRLAGSPEPGGTQTANPKTFDFGALAPGASVNAVWKLTAVRSGATRSSTG